MLIDTHIHVSHYLYDNEYFFLSVDGDGYLMQRGTRAQMLRGFQAAGIKACIDPGIDIASNARILSMAHRNPGMLFAAVGVHPTRTTVYHAEGSRGGKTHKKLFWRERKLLEKYSAEPNVVAIGETGLDYHLPRNAQHRICQKIWFIWQLKLAHKRNLPVILHVREAENDAIRILRRHRRLLCGRVCHCFRGTAKQAERYAELGLKVGIGGALLGDDPTRLILEKNRSGVPAGNDRFGDGWTLCETPLRRDEQKATEETSKYKPHSSSCCSADH